MLVVNQFNKIKAISFNFLHSVIIYQMVFQINFIKKITLYIKINSFIIQKSIY